MCAESEWSMHICFHASKWFQNGFKFFHLQSSIYLKFRRQFICITCKWSTGRIFWINLEVNNSKFKARLRRISRKLWYPSGAFVAFVTMIFPWTITDLPLENYSIRYKWWFVGIGGSQCFTSETWIIIGGPPLENFPSVWKSIPTKRPGQYQRFVFSTTVPHCSATDSARGNFLIGCYIVHCAVE